jgi:putative ribosome biogenesis GTPase RsgA
MVTILCNDLSQLKGEDATLKVELRDLGALILDTPGLPAQAIQNVSIEKYL